MRTRIIGLAVWASVLAILLFAVPLGIGVLQYALQIQRNDLERTADGVALAVARDVWKDQDIEDGEDSDAIGRRDDLAVAVYDEDGDWLAGARHRPGPPAEGPVVGRTAVPRATQATRPVPQVPPSRPTPARLWAGRHCGARWRPPRR